MEKVKLGVIGSRDFQDKKRLFDILDANADKISMIVSGGAVGADTFAHEWAKQNGFSCLIHYARWKRPDGSIDRGAGLRRNFKILDSSDQLLAFWDGLSTGTNHSILNAKQRNMKVDIIYFNHVKTAS